MRSLATTTLLALRIIMAPCMRGTHLLQIMRPGKIDKIMNIAVIIISMVLMGKQKELPQGHIRLIILTIRIYMNIVPLSNKQLTNSINLL